MKLGLEESHEAIYNTINHIPTAELSADRELLISRFNGLVERVIFLPKSVREEDKSSPPNYQTLPLPVGETDDQTLSLQIFVYDPRPLDSSSHYTQNYDPSVIAKWFVGDGGLKAPQVIEKMDYLSKKHLREKISSEDKDKIKEFEEQLVGRVDAIEYAIELYEAFVTRLDI